MNTAVPYSITAHSSVGKFLVHFFDVQLLLDCVWVHRKVHCSRTRAKQLPWSKALTHLSESYSLHDINVSTLHCFISFVFFIFFFFTGILDQSCLTGKRIQSLQSVWKYVSFKLEFREGHIFTTLVFLSNVITCFHLMWHWCLLSSSFSLLVQFLQLRCQADKQGNYVSGVYGKSDWIKIKGKKKGVKIIPGKSMHLISRKACLSLPACLRDRTAWQNSPCSPMLRPRKAPGRSAAQPVKWLVTFLLQGRIHVGLLALLRQLFSLRRGELSSVGALYWGAVTARPSCWKTCLVHLSEVTVWKHGCETSWSGEWFSQGLSFLALQGCWLQFSQMQVTQLAWIAGGERGTHAQSSWKRDSSCAQSSHAQLSALRNCNTNAGGCVSITSAHLENLCMFSRAGNTQSTTHDSTSGNRSEQQFPLLARLTIMENRHSYPRICWGFTRELWSILNFVMFGLEFSSL